MFEKSRDKYVNSFSELVNSAEECKELLMVSHYKKPLQATKPSIFIPRPSMLHPKMR